jgi:hypothetical protein
VEEDIWSQEGGNDRKLIGLHTEELVMCVQQYIVLGR